MPTRTRTVIFTDLANYTDSVGRSDREGLRNLIASHEKLVAPVLKRHGGRIVKNLGDSYMAIFESATDAVRASTELVEALPTQAAFSIRVGIATGDVEEIDGDAFGDAVNLAARILGRMPDGEVWFSQATLLCMNQAEIAWEPVGRFSLKGLPGETEIYRAVPDARAWLPEPVAEAARVGRLVRLQRGDPMPALPPRPVILLEGFAPTARSLRDVVDRLPVVDPACLWLATYNIASVERHDWLASGRGLVIGLPSGIDQAVADATRPSTPSGSDTIILDIGGGALVELVMAGLALPAVPMSEVVAGYSYDLLSDGRWVNQSQAAIGRATVSPDGVSFQALSPGVLVAGRRLPSGGTATLADQDDIVAASGTVRFQEIDGRGYAGLLLSDSLTRLGIAPGQQAEIGREPGYPGLPLPDRRGQANIRWCLGARAARARESGFTLDRALAGRRQCAVVLGPGGPSLIGLHERCPTFLAEAGRLDLVTQARPVSPGDLVVVGTSVVAVREPGA